MKIDICTPMYGGQCFLNYCEGLIDIYRKAPHHGVTIRHRFIANESLITRARNRLAHDFLQGDADGLFFIDADIGFAASHIMRILSVAKSNPDHEIIAAPYSKKRLDWEAIIRASKKDGATAESVKRSAGDLALYGTLTMNPNKLAEVDAAATGFMYIKKSLFIKLTESDLCPKYFDQTRNSLVVAFFETLIDENNRYLSEDYSFCKLAAQVGGKVLVDCSLNLTHAGTYLFEGHIEK